MDARQALEQKVQDQVTLFHLLETALYDTTNVWEIGALGVRRLARLDVRSDGINFFASFDPEDFAEHDGGEAWVDLCLNGDSVRTQRLVLPSTQPVVPFLFAFLISMPTSVSSL